VILKESKHAWIQQQAIRAMQCTKSQVRGASLAKFMSIFHVPVATNDSATKARPRQARGSVHNGQHHAHLGLKIDWDSWDSTHRILCDVPNLGALRATVCIKVSQHINKRKLPSCRKFTRRDGSVCVEQQSGGRGGGSDFTCFTTKKITTDFKKEKTPISSEV